MCQETLSDTIQQLVVNDYFTPSIRAEVILDMLLTPYIEELIDGAAFVAKEMSIPKKKVGSRGPKIDYVLAKDGPEGKPGTVFLVELKTTYSSMDEKQAGDYLTYCQGKPFGETLGLHLLTILQNNFHAKRFSVQFNAKNDNIWQDVFDQIMKRFGPDIEGPNCASRAAALIRRAHWAQIPGYRSRKYLYTLGQIVDCKKRVHSLWNSTMEVRYLMPFGPAEALSLKFFTEDAFLRRHANEPYALMLSDILKEIYKEEWNHA